MGRPDVVLETPPPGLTITTLLRSEGMADADDTSRDGCVATCAMCGEEFIRPAKSRGRPMVYCGDACRLEAGRKDRRNWYYKHGRNMQRHRRDCALCGSEFATDNNLTITCGPECGKRLSDWSRATAAGLKWYRQYGVSLPSQEAYDRRRREWKRSGERVDPIKVLERDGWRCHLCGVKTPKRLRGTTDDRAPEVDHIVPLSRGGKHSYANTACACRRCNGAKRDKPLGQMMLFGSPDAAGF